MEIIYFDHNSTTSYSPSVRKYLETSMLKDWYNPSSVYPSAQVLHQKMRESRKFMAHHLNCSPQHLFFTSGGTESINTILSVETLKLHQSSTCITSYLEHHATIKKMNFLSKNSNVQICWIPNNEQGEINLDILEATCSKYPHSLLSFLSANNETGVMTDIQAISKIARKYNCLVHVDAVQSLGKTPIDLEKWDVDFASFSGHKIGAMKGVGLLYARKPFAPLMYGGGQERNLRPGTYNYPAIQSLKLALQDVDLGKQNYVKELRDYFEKTLLSSISHSAFKINCSHANRLPNTSSIYCGGISNQIILLALAQKKIYLSEGSACNTGSIEPSHVIAELNIDGFQNKDYARSCIRVSLSSSNTKKEIDSLIQSLKELVRSASSYTNINSPVQSV